MRPSQRDTRQINQTIPNLNYDDLLNLLIKAANANASRADNLEYRRAGYLTLYRSTSHHRWDVTASYYRDQVTLYLNHTRIATMHRSTATGIQVILYADPHQQVRQTLTWLNRILTDNHQTHRLVQHKWNWYVADKTPTTQPTTTQPFVNGHVFTTLSDA